MIVRLKILEFHLNSNLFIRLISSVANWANPKLAQSDGQREESILFCLPKFVLVLILLITEHTTI